MKKVYLVEDKSSTVLMVCEDEQDAKDILATWGDTLYSIKEAPYLIRSNGYVPSNFPIPRESPDVEPILRRSMSET